MKWQAGTVEQVQMLRQALIEQFQGVWAMSFTAGDYEIRLLGWPKAETKE